MTRGVLEKVLRSRLHTFAQPLELCDESGCLARRVLPVDELSDCETWEPPITDEEIQELSSSEKWHTTAEVLAHLEKQ
jgi:hypothetical protein